MRKPHVHKEMVRFLGCYAGEPRLGLLKSDSMSQNRMATPLRNGWLKIVAPPEREVSAHKYTWFALTEKGVEYLLPLKNYYARI